MSPTTLETAVLAFTEVTNRIEPAVLEQEWTWGAEQGIWRAYDNGRNLFFRTYQELRQFASILRTARALQGPPLSHAQHILAQHHMAFRDMEGALIGIDDDLGQQLPAPNEWPLRLVVRHMLAAEQTFIGCIQYARMERQHDRSPTQIPAAYVARYGPVDSEATTLSATLAAFQRLHAQVQSELHLLTDNELDIPSLWAEGYEVPIMFRMHRFDAHLREHTIQIDKIRSGIDRPPTEPQRLARLIYNALGEVEGVLLGAEHHFVAEQIQLTTTIMALTAALAQRVAGPVPT